MAEVDKFVGVELEAVDVGESSAGEEGSELVDSQAENSATAATASKAAVKRQVD